MSNIFELDVDIKQTNYISMPTITQHDDVVFVLHITDNGSKIDLSKYGSYTLTSIRPDGQAYYVFGVKEGDKINFPLGSSELDLDGEVKASIQLYDSNGRVSTIPFTYRVIKDLSDGYIPSVDEQSLIELVMTNVADYKIETDIKLDQVKSQLAEIAFNVQSFGAIGDGIVDDTLEVQNAIDHISSQKFGAGEGGTLLLPSGKTFNVKMIYPKSNVTITGGGTLKFENNTSAINLLRINDIKKFVLDGITIDGNVHGQDVWVEGRHDITIYKCDDVTIKNCEFIGTNGDGIYINHSTVDMELPKNIKIFNNRFVGDNSNRNGISIIHGQNINIFENYFYGMTRPDMPCPIDIEPNKIDELVDNVNINNNTFIGTGDNRSAISSYNVHSATIINVSIFNNNIFGLFSTGINSTGGVSSGDTHIDIYDNDIILAEHKDGNGISIFRGNYNIYNNRINGNVSYGINDKGSRANIYNNDIKNATDYGVNSEEDVPNHGKINGNTIHDCGTEVNGLRGGIRVRGSNLDIFNNRITSSSPTKTQCGIYIMSGEHNYIAGNHFVGMNVRDIQDNGGTQVYGQNVYSKDVNVISGAYPPTSGNWVSGDLIHVPKKANGGLILCQEGGTPGTWKSL